MKDFRAAVAEASGTPIEFHLADDRVWHTNPAVQAGAIFDLAELAEAEDAGAFTAFRDFLGSVIQPDERDDFLTALRDVPLRVVIEVARWIITESTAGDFTAPSPSPAQA